VLLTHDDLRNRRRYLNARNTLLELLRLGSVPIINENDTVAVEELKLGDNDNLAANVAALIDADLMLIASDVDGLFSAHPSRDPAARPVETVDAITAGAGDGRRRRQRPRHRRHAHEARSGAESGERRNRHGPVQRQRCGGLGLLRADRFAARNSAPRRRGWQHASTGCATRRERAGRSASMPARRGRCSPASRCCPAASSASTGEFARGDIVELARVEERSCIPGRSRPDPVQLRRSAPAGRRHTRDIESILGFSYGDTIVRRDDLVALESQT
jgi:glutamate 5-kinase